MASEEKRAATAKKNKQSKPATGLKQASEEAGKKKIFFTSKVLSEGGKILA